MENNLGINLNEINELGDSELAFKTLNALTQNLDNEDEKLSLYLHAFKHFENGLLKINPVYFSAYARHLYLQKDLEKLKQLFLKIRNISSVTEYYINLCFDLGKISEGSQFAIEYFETLLKKGLASKAIEFFEKIKNFQSKNFNLNMILVKLLIAQGNDLELAKLLGNLRVYHIDHQKRFSGSQHDQKSLIKDIVNFMEHYPYKSLGVFKELMRWRVLNFIYNDTKLSKISVKSILDYYIITEDLTDYIYLTCLFNGQDQSWFKVFKSFVKNHNQYNSQYILDHHPYFFSLFKDQYGEQHPTVQVTEENSQSSWTKTNELIHMIKDDAELVHQEEHRNQSHEYEQLLKDKIYKLFDDSKSIIQVTDLLVMLRSLEFYDLMDTLFWKAHDRNLVTEEDIYLVGKTFLSIEDYSKAFSVLSYAKEEEGIKLLHVTIDKKKNQQDE